LGSNHGLHHLGAEPSARGRLHRRPAILGPAQDKPAIFRARTLDFNAAVGTIWVVAHDASRRFDLEDLRVMTNLGEFAAAAYQTVLTVNATQRIASIVDWTGGGLACEIALPAGN
jgi:hypothetical protein